MPSSSNDLETDPGKLPPADREEAGLDLDPEEATLQRRVSQQHAEDADEAELADEDILEIADLEEELDTRKGDDGPDA